MIQPSPLIARNRGSITPVNFIDDADGRRQMVQGTDCPAFCCRVHPAKSDVSNEQMREQGITPFEVHIFSDPGDVRVHDLFNWLDYKPPRVCRITGQPMPSTGQFSTWIMPVEYQAPQIRRP